MVHNFLDYEIIQDYDKISSDAPSENGLCVAPSVEYHAIGIFKDKHSEELNFPTLFYGHPRNEKMYNNFSYHKIAKWGLLHQSHDFSTNIQNIFFKATKICVQKVKIASWIWNRKGQLSGSTLTVAKVAKEHNLDKILQSYIGFQDLERLHSSRDYIEGLTKNVFAMKDK